MDDPGVGELCSVLLTNLPEDWFRLSDPRKLEKLGNAGNFIEVTSKNESKKAAVVRMLKKPGVAPTIDIPHCGAAVIIKHEEASITLQLSSTDDRNLLISTAHGLNIKVVEVVFGTFNVSGSLELVTEFRKLLEVKIMAACLDACHEGQGQGGASANAVSPPDSRNDPGRDASGWDASGVTSELKSLGNRFNPSILILMMCLDQTHGCVVKPNTGEVFMDASSNQNLFYHQYDSYSRQKLKGEVLKISKHISIISLKKEMELLKEKYNQCGYFISEDVGEITLVSLSTRQFESFLSFLKVFLGLSYTLPCGRVLSLLSGNIVQEKVDIIVNAANGSLEHAGGVAKAINDASRGEVQQYSRQYMRFRGTLRAGEVAITDAGQYLDCKKIIHAVGPVKEQRNCRSIINALVHAILNKGEELGAESIALPAISTGIFGVSKDLVAECLFKEIPAHRFRTSLPVLSDIRVVIIDQPTYSCFHKNFTKILPSKASVDQSSSLPSGVVPSNSPKAQDSRSANSTRKEEESCTAGRDRGSHKSRNKSRSPVDPDSKGKKGRSMNYDRSSSMEDKKNRKKDRTSSKVEGSGKRDSEIESDFDNLKLITGSGPVGNDSGMGTKDMVSSCPACSAKGNDNVGGDEGNEIFHDAHGDSSSTADKIRSNEEQGGVTTNSVDGVVQQTSSTVVDSIPDVSAEEPGSASSSDVQDPPSSDIHDPPSSSDIHDPPSSSDIDDPPSSSNVQDVPKATESSQWCPSTDSPATPPPGLPCSSGATSFYSQQNFSESSIKYPTTVSESSPQYAAIASASASDTASPPGLPQYSGGVGVLSASAVSKSSPQYSTTSTVSITVPPGHPQYSSAGGQPALYSAVAGQSVTQNFSSQLSQPTSTGVCAVCLKNYHMRNLARLRCGHLGCIDCVSMSVYGYHCYLCHPSFV